MSTPKTITIDGTEYVRKSDVSNPLANTFDGLKYVIVRTYSAGVFAGFLYKRSGQEVVLRSARRLWSWSGAASLSQLAIDGTTKPTGCKFPEAVFQVELLQAIEILDVTEKAKNSIESVKIWKE